jgi:acyl-coenzyme A synthetase/AMP-(fatty) acid ligase
MIVNRIYDWAAKQPNKPAIIHNDNPISYADFAHAIDALRRHLAAYDLPVGLIAVVLVADQLEGWFTTLALRSLGMNTIVVPSLSEAEKLDLDGVGAVVTTRHGAAELKLTRPKIFGRQVISIAENTWQGPHGTMPVPIDDPNRPYGGHILYTSGTTGSHKKVLKEGHQEDAQSARCALHRLIEADSVVHNLSFSLWSGVGYKQPLSVWRTGATLVIDNRPNALANFFRHRPTFVSLPPALALDLLAKTATIRRPERMAIVNLGGGFVSAQLVRQLRNAKFDQVMISYSSTECSHILRSKVDDDEQIAWLAPVEDRRIEIVDDEDRPCAVGEEGALRVGLLDHDTHDYLDDPATTAVFFRDGWFYPGDLAVRRDDGRIRILGRAGDVLNVRGTKVAAAPMEQAICQLLNLENVCLFQSIDRDGAEELVVVLEADALPAEDLRAAITANFKAFEQVRLEAIKPFPRTTTGLQKINRAELRKMILTTR